MALLEPEITWDLAVGDQDLLLALGTMWDWKVVDTGQGDGAGGLPQLLLSSYTGGSVTVWPWGLWKW